MSTVYKKNDLVSREVVRRIIDSPRTQGQMLDMLNSIPSAELSVIEDIKAEINSGYVKVENDYDHGRNYGLYMAMQIINKHLGKESE